MRERLKPVVSIGLTILGTLLVGYSGLVGAQTPGIRRSTLAKGLIVEEVPASIPSPVEAGDGLITLVRIDPAHYSLRLLTAAEHGSARPAPEWASDFGLTAVINASMFQSRKDVWPTILFNFSTVFPLMCSTLPRER